jgi:O-antigen ligase
VVGVGLNNFEVHAPRYVRQAGQLDYVAFIAERPHVIHNLYLQLLIETGILGLALFLAVALASLRACLRAAKRFERQGDPGSAALARSVFAAAVAGLTASFFLSNGTEFQLWALLAFGPALMGAAHATRSRPAA